MNPASPFLTVDAVARRLHVSTRTIHEMTRTNSIPHFKLPGRRRCLFRAEDLEQWEQGSELAVVETSGGGRFVYPQSHRRSTK